MRGNFRGRGPHALCQGATLVGPQGLRRGWALAGDEKHLLFSKRSSWKRRPPSLSSRAQPRDLQFCRPVLEMFFEKVLMQVEVKVCRAYGARTMLGNPSAQPGRAGLTEIPKRIRAP